MFRRRSSSRHQPLNSTPSASAQSAASRAFIANRNANTDLSSAAAAAALRSHTPPPTSPGNVQTKRMLQRQLSSSSRGSSAPAVRHGAQPTLHRTPSSGSMTSRTFRDLSPGRPQSSSGNTPAHPPVPPIPQNLSNRSTPSRRSASAQPVRGMRGTPSLFRGSATGRGASLDRGPGDLTASPTSPRSLTKGSSLELERPGSRTSINFSYPMSARPNSPPRSPVENAFPRSSADNSPTPRLSPVETASVQQSINNTANRKVKTKPKIAAPGSKEGSHFANKTMGSRPTGTALQDETQDRDQHTTQPEDSQPAQSSATESSPNKDESVTNGQSHSPAALEDGGVAAAGLESVRPVPKKRPSMVMEDHEGEERAEAAETPLEDVAQSPTVHKPQSLSTEDVSKPKTTREALAIHPPQTTQSATDYATRPSPSTSSAPSSPRDRLTVDHNTLDQQMPERQASISPNRSARFSTQLTVGSNSPLHEPPPRSISPAKSALKNSSSPDRRIHLGQTPSEFSDGTSVASDDGSRAGSKKKTAKVSFDDEAEVVGVAASPPTSPEPMNRSQSPVEKAKSRKWFGISKKKTAARDVAEDEEFESVLRPRPALPFFGSIRGTREPEEIAAPTLIDNDSDLSSDEDLDPQKLAASSDHGIGGILVNAQHHGFGGPLQRPQDNSTNQQSFSEPSSEALSEDATSDVAGMSDTLAHTSVPEHSPSVLEEQKETTSASVESTAVHTPEFISSETANKQYNDSLREPLPTIAILPATPGEEPRNSIDLHNMPGGFPSYAPEKAASDLSKQNTAPPLSSATETPQDKRALVDEAISDDDDSGDSIYSDAAEEPDEFQGDVFGSINAIVDSPLPTEAGLPKEVPDSPTRTITSDPLTNVAEPVPSPSLEAIHPRMPATPSSPSQAPAVASSLEAAKVSQRTQNSVSAEPSWQAENVVQTSASPSTRVQQKTMELSSDPHEGSHLRKALGKGTTQQQARPRQSLRDAPTTPSPTAAKSRRVSAASATQPMNTAPPKRQAGTRTLPNSSTYPAAASKLVSNDSDSDSSFKRSRRSSRSGAGSQYSMKRTMRTARPMSMTASETPMETSTPPRAPPPMRMTMRGSASERSSGTPSLRDTSGRSRPRSSVISSSNRSRVGADSDDEGGGGRKLFRSRFADSSDEEDSIPKHLTPVRGIPRRQGKYDGESTDLDDSSDDESKQRQARNGIAKGSPQMTQEDLDAMLSQPKKKGGFLARLRSPTRSSGKDGKVRKSKLESPARRDTPLERSRLELERMREDTINHDNDQSSNRPTSPRLQKRQRTVSAYADTWPLPPGEKSASSVPASNDTQVRPSTSDGIVNGSNTKGDIDSNRPQFSRHGTSESVDSRVTSASEVVVGRTGKKKRFPLLRKAFGLRD